MVCAWRERLSFSAYGDIGISPTLTHGIGFDELRVPATAAALAASIAIALDDAIVGDVRRLGH
jgi:hypothetical protein